jgi:hypothetical protein
MPLSRLWGLPCAVKSRVEVMRALNLWSFHFLSHCDGILISIMYMYVTTKNIKPGTYFIVYVYVMTTHVFFVPILPTVMASTETIKGKIMAAGI